MSGDAIAVLGAGSWGTALAIQLARCGNEVTLWGRDAVALEKVAEDRENKLYLPGAPLPETLTVEPDLTAAAGGKRNILVVVPSHGFRGVLEKIEFLVSEQTRVAWATKGFEEDTGMLPHEVAAQVLGRDTDVAVLSGPTFAKEVGEGLPTAMTVASPCERFAGDMATALSNQTFRAYLSGDMVGVEVGGAVKNPLAIGAGISDGLGFGANSRVALITRGLAELTRLGVALGAEPKTFMGLAGMGDLVLTCTDNLSRNRRMGLGIAAGRSIDEVAAEIGQVVEGVRAARAVHQVAEKRAIDMPIVDQIHAVLYEGKSPHEAVTDLMTRSLKSE